MFPLTLFDQILYIFVLFIFYPTAVQFEFHRSFAILINLSIEFLKYYSIILERNNR